MYRFSYQHIGGATRVQIKSGEDIRHLGELDQKKWTVLSCPASGLEINSESLELMDLDKDGQVRIKEVIGTAEWLCTMLRDPESLFAGKAEIALANIEDEALAATAKKIAEDSITLEALDAYIAAIAVATESAPDTPYPSDVIAAYKAKKDEYATYFDQVKLQKLGLATIAEDAAVPGIKEAEFQKMGSAIATWEAAVADITAKNDAAVAAAKAEFIPLRKLLLLHRDFITLLRNFVTLEDFYDDDLNRKAIFQAGTLVIDQRVCHLCMQVNDMAKHNAQAPQSGMFLIYCDCNSRTLGKSLKIVAAVTMGEIKNLREGKNAIFYDRQGNDYDATITKIIDNPISITQAFWSPYRKFGQWVTDLINKSAEEKNNKAFADLTAEAESTIEKVEKPEAEKQSAFDIAKFAGIFAAIGMALGYIGAFFTDLAKGINAMPWWQLLIWIAGIILVISGPAMILAAIKLRKRNLAPLLNANGWAVNADSLISIPFGATLTEQVQYPLLPVQKKHLSKGAKWWITIAAVVAAIAIALLVMVFFAPCNGQCAI